VPSSGPERASQPAAGGAGRSSRRAAALPGLTSDAGATKERRRSEEGRQCPQAARSEPASTVLQVTAILRQPALPRNYDRYPDTPLLNAYLPDYRRQIRPKA